MAPFSRMAWYSPNENGTKQLYLSEAGSTGWVLFSKCPRYRQPDVLVPGASAGFATAQHLLKLGWRYVDASEVTGY